MAVSERARRRCGVEGACFFLLPSSHVFTSSRRGYDVGGVSLNGGGGSISISGGDDDDNDSGDGGLKDGMKLRWWWWW